MSRRCKAACLQRHGCSCQEKTFPFSYDACVWAHNDNYTHTHLHIWSLRAKARKSSSRASWDCVFRCLEPRPESYPIEPPGTCQKVIEPNTWFCRRLEPRPESHQITRSFPWISRYISLYFLKVLITSRKAYKQEVLYESTNIWLYNHIIILLHYHIVILLYYYTIVLLYYYIIILLYYDQIRQ